MLKILAFTNNGSSPGYHRIIVPLLAMEADVFVTNNLLEAHFVGIDLFMYNRVLPEQHMEKIYKMRDEQGFKICVDVDDYWELDEHHIMYKQYEAEGFAARQIAHLRNADFVTTTHDRLVEEVQVHNPNVALLPNAINPQQSQFQVRRVKSELVRLFWQGSITHSADLALLTTPIDKLAPLSKQIQMVMAGYTEGEAEWVRMMLGYTSDMKHQYKLIPGVHVKDYYAAYRDADICMVPLLATKFNRHKSNLKVLEAAHLGLPAIVSNVHPYKEMPVLYANGAGDWTGHIRKLVRSARMRREVGQELKEWCDEHYNFDNINKERLQVFEYYVKKEAVS